MSGYRVRRGQYSTHERFRAEPVPARVPFRRAGQLAIADRWAQRAGRRRREAATKRAAAKAPTESVYRCRERQSASRFSASPSRRTAWTSDIEVLDADRPRRAHDSGPQVARGRRTAESRRRGEGRRGAARPHAAGHVPDGRRYRTPARPAPRAARAAERRDAPVHHEPACAPGAADGKRAALPALQHEAERAAAAGPDRG